LRQPIDRTAGGEYEMTKAYIEVGHVNLWREYHWKCARTLTIGDAYRPLNGDERS
jgi:hypothetical protein